MEIKSTKLDKYFKFIKRIMRKMNLHPEWIYVLHHLLKYILGAVFAWKFKSDILEWRWKSVNWRYVDTKGTNFWNNVYCWCWHLKPRRWLGIHPTNTFSNGCNKAKLMLDKIQEITKKNRGKIKIFIILFHVCSS